MSPILFSLGKYTVETVENFTFDACSELVEWPTPSPPPPPLCSSCDSCSQPGDVLGSEDIVMSMKEQDPHPEGIY